VKTRRETWDEERDRLIRYLTAPPSIPDASLDYALDVLDGKDLNDLSRPVRFKKSSQ
jgi:hypothetical protein